MLYPFHSGTEWAAVLDKDEFRLFHSGMVTLLASWSTINISNLQASNVRRRRAWRLKPRICICFDTVGLATTWRTNAARYSRSSSAVDGNQTCRCAGTRRKGALRNNSALYLHAFCPERCKLRDISHLVVRRTITVKLLLVTSSGNRQKTIILRQYPPTGNLSSCFFYSGGVNFSYAVTVSGAGRIIF